MLYGSGIYIVSKDDMASFLEEVKQQYKDIDWFLPEEYIYRYFDKRDTHKLVFLGNEVHSKSYNKHKAIRFSDISAPVILTVGIILVMLVFLNSVVI